jgi:hypothetical protein
LSFPAGSAFCLGLTHLRLNSASRIITRYLAGLLADVSYWPKAEQMQWLSAGGTGMLGFDMKTYNYYSHSSSDSQAFAVEHKVRLSAS